MRRQTPASIIVRQALLPCLDSDPLWHEGIARWAAHGPGPASLDQGAAMGNGLVSCPAIWFDGNWRAVEGNQKKRAVVDRITAPRAGSTDFATGAFGSQDLARSRQ